MVGISLGRNTVSMVAILALTGLGGYWAYAGVDRFLFAAILIIVAIAGLGGYSMKQGDIPFPPGDGGSRDG